MNQPRGASSEAPLFGRDEMKKTVILLTLMLTALGSQANDIAVGRAKADTACALCHGAKGIASMPGAPNLAGQQHMYLVEQLRLYRSGARPNAVMNVIAKTLTDAEIEGLSQWYASIAVKVE